MSKGVGFIRFDQRNEAERAIQELNGKVPKGCTDPITVKFANNPSNNAKAMPPLAAYLTPQARRFAAGALPAAGRFRLAEAQAPCLSLLCDTFGLDLIGSELLPRWPSHSTLICFG